MELAQDARPRSGKTNGDRWRAAGARLWRAVVASGMSRAASHLDLLTGHYAPSQPVIANELRGAAKWARLCN